MSDEPEISQEHIDAVKARAAHIPSLSVTLSGLIVQQIDLYEALAMITKAVSKLDHHGIATHEIAEATAHLESSFSTLREVGDRFFGKPDER